MQEALASADHDFVLAEPGSKLKRLHQGLLAGKRLGLRRKMRRGRRALTVIAASAFAVIAAGILLNALFLQKARHPAPLFARPLPAPGASKPPEPASGPRRPVPALPVEAPGRPVAARDVQFLPAGKPPAPAGAAALRKSANSAPAPAHDGISQLLNATPTAASAAAAAKPTTAKLALAAQRALVKLGFVLKPDGVAGPATRQAIERYERERGLPVRGDVTPALVRRLSAESGVPEN